MHHVPESLLPTSSRSIHTADYGVFQGSEFLLPSIPYTCFLLHMWYQNGMSCTCAALPGSAGSCLSARWVSVFTRVDKLRPCLPSLKHSLLTLQKCGMVLHYYHKLEFRHSIKKQLQSHVLQVKRDDQSESHTGLQQCFLRLSIPAASDAWNFNSHSVIVLVFQGHHDE